MKTSFQNPNCKIQSLAGAQAIALWMLCLGLWTLLPGCAVGPNYKRPAVNTPETFRGETRSSTNSFADLPWWQVFHDEQLQWLIREALTNNYDLRIAVSRMEQARAQAAEARSQLFPQIDYGAAAGGGKNAGANNQPSPTGVEGTVFAGDVQAAWEIDLWGRIRRQTEAAQAQYFASQEARRDVTISLIAQVAQDYFQLLALDRQLQIAYDSTNSFAESLKIFNQRLRGGVASKLETASAEALLDAAAATVPDLEQQIASQENQLNVLLGRNPGAIERTNLSLDAESSPDVPAGLPSALLERRPDIREAEQQLRAANAQVGVAKANFFPQLDLTGMFGRVSPELATITSGQATLPGTPQPVSPALFSMAASCVPSMTRHGPPAREPHFNFSPPCSMRFKRFPANSSRNRSSPLPAMNVVRQCPPFKKRSRSPWNAIKWEPPAITKSCNSNSSFSRRRTRSYKLN